MTFCGHLPFQMKSAYFSVFIQSALNCYMWHNQDPVHLTLKSTFILCCWKSYDQNVFFFVFLFFISRWLSSPFGRRRLRMNRTWYTFAVRLRSCHPSATPTSSLYMKVRVCECAHVHKHTRSCDNDTYFIRTHKQKHGCPEFFPPRAHLALVAKL